MQDQDLDTSSDSDVDTSGDTTGGSSGGDNLESGGRTSDATDDTGDDGGSEPDQDGYTPADRKELEGMRSRMKAKDDKISQDGQRIKALETEVERLKERQDGRSEAQDRNAQDTNGSDRRRTYREPPNRRTRERTDANGDNQRRTPAFSDADIRRLPREQQRIYANMWEMADQANKRAEELEAELTEVKTYQSSEQQAKQDDAQYQEYRNHYGLTREQYNEVMQARGEGDHFTADRLLNVHSAAASRRRERAETTDSAEASFLPPGSPDTPAPTRRESPEETMRKEFEAATTEKQKDEIAQRAWSQFPSDVAERITLPPPSA